MLERDIFAIIHWLDICITCNMAWETACYNICVYILYTLSLSIYLCYLLIVKRNNFSNNYIIITKGTLMCSMYDLNIVYVILTHLGAGTNDVVQWGNAPKWFTASCSPWWPWIFYQFTAYHGHCRAHVVFIPGIRFSILNELTFQVTWLQM